MFRAPGQREADGSVAWGNYSEESSYATTGRNAPAAAPAAQPAAAAAANPAPGPALAWLCDQRVKCSEVETTCHMIGLVHTLASWHAHNVQLVTCMARGCWS